MANLRPVLLATCALYSAVVAACASKGPSTLDVTDPPGPTVVLLEAATPPARTSATPSTASADLPRCFSPSELTPFAFAPESDRILIRTRGGVQAYDLATGQLVAERQAEADIATAALSPDGNLLAWSLFDNRIQLISMDTGDLVAAIRGHSAPALDLRFSADGNRLFSASHDGWVRIWTLDGSESAAIQVGGELLGFGLSADERWLATVPADGPVLLWDLADGSLAAELGGSGGYDTSEAEFSADGQYLVADLATGIYLWRLADRQLVWNQVANSMAATFAPEEPVLAYSDVDRAKLVVLASEDGERVLRTLDRERGPVWALFFSADGGLMAIGDGVTIEIWRMEDGSLIAAGRSDCP